jgi:hypothetical protein
VCCFVTNHIIFCFVRYCAAAFVAFRKALPPPRHKSFVLYRPSGLCAYLSSPFRSLCFWFVKVFISSALSGFGVVHFFAAQFLFLISRVLWWLPVAGSIAQFGHDGSAVFSSKGSGQRAGCPTQRAPDVWESGAFSSIFLASGFSCSQSLSTPAHTRVTPAVGLLNSKT